MHTEYIKHIYGETLYIEFDIYTSRSIFYIYSVCIQYINISHLHLRAVEEGSLTLAGGVHVP